MSAMDGETVRVHQNRRIALGACVAVSLLATGSLGYIAGSASARPASTLNGTLTSEASSGIEAVSAGGEASTLTGEAAEAYEENTTPIDQTDVTFDENTALSRAEVEERKDALADHYSVGQPLSAEDLEFMRAYLIDAEPPASASSPAIEAAAYGGAEARIVPAALYNLNQSFNVTISGAGATANASGRITGGIDLVDANWGVSWTTKRTGGKALTKITSSVKADAFGAVAAWPFVGLIYSKSYSATSPSGASSWSFSRNGRATGAVAYMQMDCRSYVYTTSGSFALP
ncbi:hypothetical protein [Microbacterium sp. K35]|uniref:hypothetical protein n=1 Tax=Microbacterium sp. K35 TaxID=2305440 RepID=UPI00109B945D|nr:hypothetical protein [Microbacterium sp. K35]